MSENSHIAILLTTMNVAKKIGAGMQLHNPNIVALIDEIDELNARIAKLEAENDRLQDAWFLDETICPDGSPRPTVSQLLSRIAELEAERASLGVRIHDEMSQLEIATDLGNKRWTALNKIYEDGEKHNTNWCKRKAQEGLGIK